MASRRPQERRRARDHSADRTAAEATSAEAMHDMPRSWQQPMRIRRARLRAALGTRAAIVLVGLMGAGKTTVGRRLATRARPAVRRRRHRDRDGRRHDRSPTSSPSYGEPRLPRRRAPRDRAPAADGPARARHRRRRLHERRDPRADHASAASRSGCKADLDVLVRRVPQALNRPLLQTARTREATMRKLHGRGALPDLRRGRHHRGDRRRAARPVVAEVARRARRPC